jgi:outer membrane protein OmpA-like peptidoglycan-associated protein
MVDTLKEVLNVLHPFRVICFTVSASAFLLLSFDIHAQQDVAMQRLIDQLTPRGAQVGASPSRGIRRPVSTASVPSEDSSSTQGAIAGTPRLYPSEGTPPNLATGDLGPPPTFSAPAQPSPTPRPPVVRPSQSFVANRPTTAPPQFAAASLTILFETGSAELASEAQEDLITLGRALSSGELSDFRFKIEGHTDRVGSAANNQVLSERRASAVRDFLIARFAIAPQRLVSEGLGETQPLITTADEVAHPRNRRVQVINMGESSRIE